MNGLNGCWDDICRELATDGKGLTGAEAARRLAVHGPNTLTEHETAGALLALLRLFANPLVAVLLVSAVLSYFLGEVSGALIIAVMVVLSVALQFYHEYRSGAAAADSPAAKATASPAPSVMAGRPSA